MTPRKIDPVVRAEAAADLDPAQLVAVLGQIADELDTIGQRQSALWRARLIVFHEARRRDDPLVLTSLAAASRVSTVAVIAALRKDDPLISA